MVSTLYLLVYLRVEELLTLSSDPLAGTESVQCSCDLAATSVDKQGWSVLHHMVCSLPLGAYENMHMLQLLHNAGAPLDIKDRNGLIPLQHAIKRGATHLVKALQYVAGTKQKDWVRYNARSSYLVITFVNC